MSTQPARAARAARRDRWVAAGMLVAAVAAALSSFAGLYNLAVAAGWNRWLAPLFPLTVDVYALTATRVWLASGPTTAQARGFARWNALLAVGLSLVGNGIWHLAEAGLIRIGWPVVLATGSGPPLVLGLLSHLAVLHGQDDGALGTAAVLEPKPEPDTEPESTDPRTEPAPAEDGLLAAARAADARYRAKHDGRPITRDALRQELGVSTARAGEVLREMRLPGQ